MNNIKKCKCGGEFIKSSEIFTSYPAQRNVICKECKSKYRFFACGEDYDILFLDIKEALEYEQMG